MRLDLDMEIRFSSGERAGHLRKVVLDRNNDVKQVVMSTEDLMSKGVIVPVDMLSEGPGGDIFINCTTDDLKNLTEYTEERVPVVAEGWSMSEENVSPMGEVFPESTYEPIMPIVEVPNIPEGSISLGEGTEIWCLDGRWGVVDEVLTDESGHTKGFIGRPDESQEPDGMVVKRLIPIQLMQEVDATMVSLSCNLSELPSYTEEVGDIVDEEEHSF